MIAEEEAATSPTRRETRQQTNGRSPDPHATPRSIEEAVKTPDGMRSNDVEALKVKVARLTKLARSQEKAATLTYNQTLIPGSDWSDWARGGLSLVSSRTWKSVTDQTCRQLVTITNINSQFHQKPISRCQLSEADQGKSVQNVEETKFMVKVWLMWLHIVLMNELTDHRALMQLSNVPPPQYNVRLV